MSKIKDPSTANTHGQATAKVKTPDGVKAGAVIYVSDIEELYTAVNDPNNAGASIVLRGEPIMAAQTYVLSALDSRDQLRPNRGRLHLQKDMKLYGLTGSADAIKIDARGLPVTSLVTDPNDPANSLRISSIAVGSGNNAIEWLTILANPRAAGSIGADLPGADPTTIRIANVISREESDSVVLQAVSNAGPVMSTFASRGIDIRNLGESINGQPTNKGRLINLQVEKCEFFGHKQGIRFANFEGSDGAQIVVVMNGNRSHDNSIGCLLANNGTSKSGIDVTSTNDTFEGNAGGCIIAGALARVSDPALPAPKANNNSVRFTAIGSHFENNRLTKADFQVGGVVVLGGEAFRNRNGTSENQVEVHLDGCTILNNRAPNFATWGARNQAATSQTSPEIPGTDNLVTIELSGSTKGTQVEYCDSYPSEKSNRVQITGGQTVLKCN